MKGPERAHIGTITAVRTQTRDPNRVSVYVDGAFSFGLPADEAVTLGLRTGSVVDEGLLGLALAADARARARRRALDLLAARARSEHELRRRLANAGFDETVVQQTVVRMTELGYVDDDSFARSYVESRVRSKGFGPRRILVELRRRGVDEALAERAVAEVFDSRDSLSDAVDHGRRFQRRLTTVNDGDTRRRRLYGYLVRRGFSGDVIRSAIAALEAEDPGAA